MSIIKSSSVDDICSFLRSLKIKENIITKFQEEKIKGNELFYLTDQDYEHLGLKNKKTGLKKKLEEIKNITHNILDYNINIDINSKEKEVLCFLEKEIRLAKDISDKFNNINGQKFKYLKEDNLVNFGLKLGERRKILNYILSMASNIQNNITQSSTIEEVCSFLKIKFNLSEDEITDFKENDIDGAKFFNFGIDDLSEFDISEEKQKEILNYINTFKLSLESKEIEETEEIEEQINEEEKYKIFELIEIIEYLTSEEEYNKCPFNKTEGFIELCNFMGIDNLENCKIINFNQASKMNINVTTIWGSIEALFEFFYNRKMINTLEYFKNKKNTSGGIFLLIKEDKSFGYILIWPGTMKYLYRSLEEPQKDLLLSLVRIGFSLSDNNIICLSEKQKNEFDFLKTKIFNSEEIPEAREGHMNIQEGETYFKLGEDLEIKYEFNSVGKIKNIKLNDSSLLLYISTNESVKFQMYDKLPIEQLNFNAENVIINQSFELNGYDFYNFIKKFVCLKNLIQEKEYLEIEKIERVKIQKIKSYYSDSLLGLINNFNLNNFICEFCQKSDNDNLYSFSCDNHCIYVAHENCFPEKEGMNNIKKELISKKDKCEILFELLSRFYNNCIIKYEKYSKLNNIIYQYLLSISTIQYKKRKKYLKKLNNLLEEIKRFIETECRKMLLEVDEEIYHKNLNWKNNVIKNIKQFHQSKYIDIYSWYEYTNSIYNCKEKKYYFSYKKYSKNESNDIIKLFNIFKYTNENYYLLEECEGKKWNNNEYNKEFENYFDKDKNGILIKKYNDYYEIKLKEKIIKFNNCYDFYKDILIISRQDEETISSPLGNFLGTISFGAINYSTSKTIVYIKLYYLDEGNKIKFSKEFRLNGIGNLLKIKIVPNFGSSPKYVWLFTKNSIILTNIEDFQFIYSLKLDEMYIEYNFELFQFLFYGNFLIIFFYDEKKISWDFDIFEIKSNKIIKKEKFEYNLNFTSKEGKFAICMIKNDIPILYFCYLINGKFHIKLKQILTSTSSLEIESDLHDDIKLDLTEGNCVLNYFYHVFIKYPSIGALQYNYNKEEKIKKIYLYSNRLKQTIKFKNYLKELKEMFILERQLNSDDIKYEFDGIFKKNKIITSISLDDLIIKFIEVIPLQIAKIKNYYFKAMSNGKDIKKEELYEKYSKYSGDMNIQISIEDYANFIDFGMKNAIFNFYDLPVVVLSFMGAQSIGKSTLSNELVESFFNVSGMRCTEGIWMAVCLLKGDKTSKKCESICKCCNKEKCRLFIHNAEIQCICENCSCNEICCLFRDESENKEEKGIEDHEKGERDKSNHFFCEKRCALPLGHIKICTTHSDKKCEKHRNKCHCEKINKKMQKHICEISPYNHGFICVSLDFEGLGTFERSLEQDIDLAMVGAALSNSLILRADKTFDTFMQSRMMDWSEGSKKIKNFKNTHYFGGNIVFCQKDIPTNNYEK